MKKPSFSVLFLTMTLILNSQAPQSCNYQAIVRGASGNEVVDQAVGMQISIPQGSAGGTAVTNGCPYDGINKVKGVCPTGWHLPANEEWTELVDFLEGLDLAGGKLKETDFTHWENPNTGADNSIGFIALPAGGREYHVGGGMFYQLGYNDYWWSSAENETSPILAHGFELKHNSAEAYYTDLGKSGGFSVRYVKDQ